MTRAPLPTPRGPHRPLFLVVDDDADLRAYVRASLRPVGDVIEAVDGIEALQLAGRHREKLCAVVADVVMPRMGGVELRSRLAADRELSGVPVLLITGEYPDSLDGSVLRKPFNGSDLRSHLSPLLHSTSTTEELTR